MDHRQLLQVIDLGNGSHIVPDDQCFCKAWQQSRGSRLESQVAGGLQWFAFAFSLSILAYYAYHAWRATCGWEEVYVCCVELTKVIIEFFHEYDAPASLLLPNGHRVQWLRYGEWLLTCPVILIHLSNLTGLQTDYSNRTMLLLVSDIGTIAMGTTAAMSAGPPKIVFFLLGCAYAVVTFYHASMIYIEGYHMVPHGRSRTIVRCMAWVFFLSWGAYPVLFLLGPEGFGNLSIYGSIIGHTVIDVLSKNVWGLLGHNLRNKVWHHIEKYGDTRRKIRVKLTFYEFEVMALHIEEAPKIKERYAPRESFSVVIHDRAISGTGTSEVTSNSCRMSVDVPRKSSIGAAPRASGNGMVQGVAPSQSCRLSVDVPRKTLNGGGPRASGTGIVEGVTPSQSCRLSVDVPRKTFSGSPSSAGIIAGSRRPTTDAFDVTGPLSQSCRLSVDVPRKTASGYSTGRRSSSGMTEMETRVTSARLSVDGPRKVKAASVVPMVDVEGGSTPAAMPPSHSRLSTPLGQAGSRHSNAWEDGLGPASPAVGR
ncbi:Sensory rhodopsin-1 [Tetrabaena socialis]|uniref:Sensory rhodopsin-1 n=1 Tax=Tetrabaena socialis TaxID=47790 RepID=A0A2J8A9R5_9CHLO|nr:Sensory rhodopsin-1 [Tetrabaena socialis]|eukprot:PNH09251.1 Sensory rhodopsin-1 [Tetrabaena socialis]